jgi:6-pyruvoyltetrahydropterin/6-carboxytetrahydropterin synthase
MIRIGNIMGKFYSTKTYGNDRGLSCVFRQWRSNHSHCSLLHGYSIGVKVIFECETLDERNWVMDFGGLKDFKSWLEYMFDHTLLIAKDDPFLETFKAISELTMREGNTIIEEGRVCDLRIVDAVGCERFSELAYNKMMEILTIQKESGILLNDTVRVKSVEVFEHGANSAIYEG